ncbi:hypothetical protein JF50_17400 [Pseudoalteromonas luteoviolacea]|uniref:histidine kinase n=1 Tax=Pseudoalteromonas luteoviolacea TaxID=43657 RepID=A0A023Q169_9GAMM|nr:HAMP domain-containing histidine kinase [Pseudoalteromonas luteoviolacea]AHX39887.1 sensory transduction protein kinase [Pseudoalteromonas luteoviolacea]KID56075.1 hypothetical protein JF50_17400 [Pseudoalteromonas luteoviolacea]
MANPQSLGRYFTLRFGIFFIVFMAIWIQVATWVYHYAWDDTTEHYLYQDLALAHSGQLQLPFESAEKYIGAMHTMPIQYQKILSIHDIEYEHTLLLPYDKGDMYLLKSEDNLGRELFVIHVFSQQTSPSLLPIFLILSGFMLVPIGLLIWRIWRAISRDIGGLKQHLDEQQESAPTARFVEFAELQSSLILARFARQHAQQKERLFSAFLSHEIRTPLTKINHSIHRLQQIDDIPLAALDIFEELEIGQTELTEVADAVLLLSQPNKAKLVCHALLPILITWQKKWAGLGLIIHFDNEFVLNEQAVQLKLLQLLLTQIAKNALQHGEGALYVRCDVTGIEFENSINVSAVRTGYGLGSKIATQVCDCFGWQYNVTVNDKYKVRITWGS